MKKSSFFLSIACILAVLFIFGCGSSPDSSSDEPLTASASSGPANVWTLLGRGDSNVRDYFLGEVGVNEADTNGKTPLHYAAERGDAQLATFFTTLGGNPNALDNTNQSPLTRSITGNNAAVAAVLVGAGADIHLPVAGDTTAAQLALAGSPEVFRAILTPASIEAHDANNQSVLHLAAIEGKVQSVQDIISIMPSGSGVLNRKDNSDKNALDYALERPESRDHMEIAEQLILAGGYSQNPIFNYFAPAARSANYNIRRTEGLSPIHFAVMNGYTGFISFLINKHIDINIKSTTGATALHEAVRTGRIPVITMLLDNGADPNARDSNNNTPLHTGIPSEVHLEVITLLLAKNADPNLRDEHGETPLHIAIILNRSVQVVQALLNGRCDVHIRNIEGKTPLYIAVQEERTEIIPLLLSYESEIFAANNAGTTPFDLASRAGNEIFNLLIVEETVNQRDSAGNTMLHAAVRNRVSPRQLEYILEHRALIDTRNRDGDTPLHIAVRLNTAENGEFLISQGANIFSLNSEGHSPLFIGLSSTPVRQWMINPTTIAARDGLGNNILHWTVNWALNSVIPIVLRGGVPIEETNATGETPIFMAVKINNPSTIGVLINQNADINARDNQGNSLLHTAVRWNARASAELLITNRIDINASSVGGNTPLHDSIIFRMADIETLLINSGANLETRNVDGNTPFMEAVRLGYTPSVEKLASNFADPSTRNIRGDTPLHLAVSTDNTELVNILLRLGVSIHARNTMNRTPFQISLSVSPGMVRTLLTRDRINTSDDSGNSALHIAVQERVNAEMIRSIITQGARLNAVDNNGKTPLRLAVDMDLLDAAKEIADAGADPFIAAIDNRTAAELSFSKGEQCIRAVFSGRAINARDSSGNTVMHLAARYGTPQIITLLISNGGSKTTRNISSETPHDIAVRFNMTENAELLVIN